MCGATSLGQQAYLLNLLETFNIHFTFSPFYFGFFFLNTFCLLGILTSYIHAAWFVSFPTFIYQLICFFLILCTCFWVWGKKHGPLLFWELFLLFVGCFFFFFINCVHAFEFRARNTTPLFFGSFFFYLLVIFSFVLLYCV
jgi:hypothetical protein